MDIRRQTNSFAGSWTDSHAINHHKERFLRKLTTRFFRLQTPPTNRFTFGWSRHLSLHKIFVQRFTMYAGYPHGAHREHRYDYSNGYGHRQHRRPFIRQRGYQGHHEDSRDRPNDIEEATRAHVKANKECEDVKAKYQECKKKYEEAKRKLDEALRQLKDAKRRGSGW